MEERIGKKVETSVLLSWYGPLLTDMQARVTDLYLNEDLSLAEIAERLGVSRQGVYDTVNRAGRQLEQYEQKLRLAERSSARLETLYECLRLAQALDGREGRDEAKKLCGLLSRLIDEEEQA